MDTSVSESPEVFVRKWAVHVDGSDQTHTPPGGVIKRTIKNWLYFMYCTGLLFARGKFIKNMLARNQKYDPSVEKRQSGEVVVITGGPRGIASELAKKFLNLNFIVIMGVRDLKASQAKVDQIQNEGNTNGIIYLLSLNLNSLSSTKHFAHTVLSRTSRVDILINNGTMMTPYECTEDGFEGHFQINYLSHFLLTKLLLPTIIKTSVEFRRKDSSCRIINTSSVYHLGGSIDFNDLETRKVYSASQCYCDSKLCQVLYTKELERRLQLDNVNVHVYTVHPGGIVTDLWDGAGIFFKSMKWMRSILPSMEDGADAIIQAALSSKLEKLGGTYFEGLRPARTNPQANDVTCQTNLWARSEFLVGKFT